MGRIAETRASRRRPDRRMPAMVEECRTLAPVVMFVFNDCTTDARVLREARSISDAGHPVTIIARPRNLDAIEEELERREGFEIVRVPIPPFWRAWWMAVAHPLRARGFIARFVRANLGRFPAGWLALFGAVLVSVLALPIVFLRIVGGAIRRARRQPPPPGGGNIDYVARWVFSTLGWARAAARRAPRAAVYHGHDLTALPAAVWAADRNGGLVVYDSHEIFMESGGHVGRPRLIRALFGWLERRWVGHASAVVTVNHALARELQRRLHAARIVVVHNCAPRWVPPHIRPELLRVAAGIPAGSPIALYHGGFTRHRGIEELAAALLEPGLEGIHLVCLGYGNLRAELDRMAADERYGGRMHVLDAVPPDQLIPWVASADVGVMPIQPTTLNHLLSTPNKLFESLAGGIPVVVSDFPEMRRIVLDDPAGPLGEVCDPDDPADVARAIRVILARSTEELEALRARCLRAAHERWNWEAEAAPLLALYEGLVSAADPRSVVSPFRSEPRSPA